MSGQGSGGSKDANQAVSISLVGAVVGDWCVSDRTRRGKRWLYVLVNTVNGDIQYRRGYEVVRLARQASATGRAVVMPHAPWRDEEVV